MRNACVWLWWVAREVRQDVQIRVEVLLTITDTENWEVKGKRDEGKLLCQGSTECENKTTILGRGYFSAPSVFGNPTRGILLAVSCLLILDHLMSFWQRTPSKQVTETFLCSFRLLRRLQSTLSSTPSPPQEELSQVLADSIQVNEELAFILRRATAAHGLLRCS